METLVLAAGRSTRISSVTAGAPKPLLEVAGQTVLERNLRWLRHSGVTSVHINLHHRADLIRARLGDGSALGLAIRYLQEPELLGTAGALRNLAPPTTTLVVYGDNLIRFPLEPLFAAHRRHQSLVTIAVFEPDVVANTGIFGGRVELNENLQVERFVEGGSVGSVNAGVYLVEPPTLEMIPPGPYDFARQLFPQMLAQGLKLGGYRMPPGSYCLGLDTPESWARAGALFDQGLILEPSPQQGDSGE